MKMTTKSPPGHVRRPCQEVISKLSTISEDTLTPLNEPFQYHDADLVLFSCEGLSFKIHGSKLVGCSILFRSTVNLSLPTPPPSPGSSLESQSQSRSHSQSLLPEIHLSEPTSNGITISLFLYLLYSLSLPVPTLPVYFQAYESLITFLKKWECDILLDRLGDEVKVWVEDGFVSASKGFKIGDSLKNAELCLESIRKGGEYTWSGRMVNDPSSPTPKTKRKDRISTLRNEACPSRPFTPTNPSSPIPFDVLRDGIAGASSLDLTAVPYEYFISLSDEVKFALLRASRVGESSKQEMDWGQVADEFERGMSDLRKWIQANPIEIFG
ncbi:uncharacterized protein IL334_004350 [Kwoniella shivajii]|uniref:BTB domain-containing protein n=1 Tax=Kwoniella shivajii TaxID=564305 RepID=A0ABZ1D1F9_9TREE|nr:hypothetical protein IL334_004350 [Kwoniella shivajii]